MHPFYCALHVPYLPMRVTCGALAAHRYTYAPPRCRTSQYRRTFYSTVSVPVQRSNSHSENCLQDTLLVTVTVDIAFKALPLLQSQKDTAIKALLLLWSQWKLPSRHSSCYGHDGHCLRGARHLMLRPH